ncbi:MAG: aldo/keto reductase [Cyclobacteriaceae bacterium]
MTDSANDPVSKLGLGTVQFGLKYGISNTFGRTPGKEVQEILRIAANEKINLIDTASAYGISEEVVGGILPKSHSFNIVSKFPSIGDSSVTSFFRQSCERLVVRSLYGYMAHQADELIANPGQWDELISLRENGYVRKIGYSLYTLQQAEKLLSLGMIPDLVQVPYNVLDRRFEALFPELKKYNTEIHVRSAFLQGLFFVDPDTLPAFFDPLKPHLRSIRSQYPENSLLSGALLYFCTDNRMIDRVIAGVNTTDQLLQNVRALRAKPRLAGFHHAINIDEKVLLPYNWPVTEP